MINTMQRRIEAILKEYGYQFLDGYMDDKKDGIYHTIFRKGNKDFKMTEITHHDDLI